MVSALIAVLSKDASILLQMRPRHVARTDARNARMATTWMKEDATLVVTQYQAASNAYHRTSALSVRVSS